MKKFFTVVDDYLENKICDQYIHHYNVNVADSYEYNDTRPLPLPQDGYGIIERICKDFGIQSTLDNLEIVKREKGSLMENHYDEGDALAFILYLNDDFQGGETVFENDTVIKPKTGRLLVFSNSVFLHKVNEIKEGTRYVIAGWFK